MSNIVDKVKVKLKNKMKDIDFFKHRMKELKDDFYGYESSLDDVFEKAEKEIEKLSKTEHGSKLRKSYDVVRNMLDKTDDHFDEFLKGIKEVKKAMRSLEEIISQIKKDEEKDDRFG